MKFHDPIRELPSTRAQAHYEELRGKVESLEVGEILPVECVDMKERKQVWDYLRFTFPDLILTQREKFVYAERGTWDEKPKGTDPQSVATRNGRALQRQ